MASPTKTDRRAVPDRRNPTTRRRHADARRLYVELCHSVLRVALVVDSDAGGKPSLTTRTVTWRHDADSLTADRGREELAAALGKIVAEDRLAGCHVSLAISSTLCVNRATSGAIAKVEQELAEIRDRSQLYLSLGPGPKTAAVARKQIDARHEHALVTVANQHTLGVIVQAAEAAGLVIDVVESALVALSRLQGRLEPGEDAAVILAQLDGERFEVGVCRRGQLLLEYRPSAEATVRRLGQVIDDHYERLRRFCARQYGVGSMELARMWLVGSDEEVVATVSRTRTPIATRVIPLEGLRDIWEIDPTTDAGPEMGAALGLALRQPDDENSVSPNLMDEVHARAKPPLRPFLIRATLPLAATLLVAATLWLFNLREGAQLAALRAELDAVRPAQLEGERLSKELRDALAESTHLAQLAKRTPATTIGPLVQRAGQCLPEDVWLKSWKLTDRNHVALSGDSYTETGVYDFVRHLEETPEFREVALRGTGIDQTPRGAATSFDIDLELAPAAPAPEEK